jgi:hypothetical protein
LLQRRAVGGCSQKEGINKLKIIVFERIKRTGAGTGKWVDMVLSLRNPSLNTSCFLVHEEARSSVKKDGGRV